MQDRDLRWLLLQRMGGQHVGKEVVVAKPVAFIVQRHDKQVAALQGIQQQHAVVLAGDGIAQRATQPVENGGLEQEAPHTFGLALEYLFDEIVHDVAVVAGESLDEPGNVRAPPHRECRQLQTGNPAFGARLQGGDFLRRELQIHHLVEKAGGFGGGKAQIGGTQLGHLAPGA